MTAHENLSRCTFRTPLGWISMVGSRVADDRGPTVLRRLVFGYRSAEAAERALGPTWRRKSTPGAWDDRLRERLTAYAGGEPVALDDVLVDFADATPFAQSVWSECRRIPYGETRTYAKLAAAAGSPRAARAVGNCMAANPLPLVVPCHRVVPSGGRLGRFSAPGGAKTKCRLLEMERDALATQVGP